VGDALILIPIRCVSLIYKPSLSLVFKTKLVDGELSSNIYKPELSTCIFVVVLGIVGFVGFVGFILFDNCRGFDGNKIDIFIKINVNNFFTNYILNMKLYLN
jgi:hypothetical protein